MNTLKNEFLRNYERYVAVLGDDLGYVPPTELSRKVGLGEVISPYAADEAKLFAHLLPPATHLQISAWAAAYRATANEQHAEAAKRYYLAWIEQHPVDSEVALHRQLDQIVHGLYGWLGTLHLLLPSPAFDDRTADAIIETARRQLAYLAENLWPEPNWINLRTSYAASLLCNALRLAFLPEASAWLNRAAQVMSDVCHRQINADGSHVEATPHYHVCVAGDILNVFRKARLLPELGLKMCPRAVASLFDYQTAATHPSGWISSLHDGHYGGPTAIRGNGIADALTERAAFREAVGLPATALPLAQVFPDAGQAFLRDGWSNDATYLTFDATRFGGYHQHPSCNAIQLQAFGRMLLVDPGRLSYQRKPWSTYGWSTRAHSTMNVNGWNQMRGQPLLRHCAAPGYDLLAGCYSGGYWDRQSVVDWNWHAESAAAIFAEHQRLVLWIHHRCFVVIDCMLCADQGGQPRQVECVWQLGEGPVTLNADNRIADTGHDDANLRLHFAMQPSGTTLLRYEGEIEPVRGWVATEFDKTFSPAPQLVQQCELLGDTRDVDLATVLVPYRGAAPAVETRVIADPVTSSRGFFHPGHGHLQLVWRDGSRDDILWRRGLRTALDEQDGFLTDGSLVHLQHSAAGSLQQGLVVDGTYIAPYETERRERSQTFRVGPT